MRCSHVKKRVEYSETYTLRWRAATAASCRCCCESNPIVKQSGSNPSSRCKLNKSNCKVQNLIHCCSTLRRAVLYGRGKHNVESLITLLFFEHSTLASSSTPLSEQQQQQKQLLVKLSVAKQRAKVQCPFFSNRELPLDVVSTIRNVSTPKWGFQIMIRIESSGRWQKYFSSTRFR